MPRRRPSGCSARTVIWAAGVAGSRLGAEIARGTGAVLDRAGRVVVAPDLSVAGHPEISVVGDLAAAESHGPKGTSPVPGVSPAAKQMGRVAAANIVRRLAAKRRCRFTTATTATWRRSVARRRSSSSPFPASARCA